MTVTIQIIDREQWRQFAPTFHDYNYRQLWDFGIACANRVGAVSEHVGIFDKDRVIGLADVRIKTIPLTGTGIAYVNGGPLVRGDDGSEEIRLNACLSKLREEFVKNRHYVLRIQPPFGPEEWVARQASVFEKNGFEISPDASGYRTLLLDLSQSLDLLRKNLTQKWRSNLKKGESGSFDFQSDNSEESFLRFYNLYLPFIQKKGFTVDLDPGFFLSVQQDLPPEDQFKVILCQFDGQLISGHVSSRLGDTAVNLFRANTDAALTQHASYVIQWKGVCDAHQQGYRWYDLGGIDPVGNPGVYAFKKGMGGVDISVRGPYEIYPSRWSKWVVTNTEKWYRRFKKKWKLR